MSGRGRGRPRKYPEKQAEQAEQAEDIRRGRGRPRKVENSQSRENLPRMLDADKFRGRGRPRKAAVSESIQSSDKSLETEEDSVQMYEKEPVPVPVPVPVPAAEPLVLISASMASMPDSQTERWRLRSMWQLAAVLDFLHVFRPVLNITMEFSAEELETALITPNNILRELHIQLLKGIPPVSRTALGSDTWVTALCKKITPWWPWVAEGEVPLVICHGEEIQSYKALDPGIRLLILKALCEIRLDQDDVSKYIDDSLKQSIQLSTFSKVPLGGDAHGISYWYDGDSIIGHRLYREFRKIEVKPKPKGKGRTPEPLITCQWETIATDLDEFQTLSEKLTSSRNKLEAGIGKKIKNDILPVLEELQKKKERALKKQQRQAMLLDNFFGAQGEAGGRSRRDRKPVKYTFDDYDRSIDEAIQLTKKNRHASEPLLRRDMTMGDNPEANGHGSNPENALSSESKERSVESDVVREPGPLTRSNRLRPRAQGYLQRKYVSDDDVGDGDGEFMEAVYDAGQTESQKDRKASGSSEGEEEHSEYDGDEEYKEDDGDEEYKEDDGDEEYREDEDDLEVDDDDEDLSIDSDGRQARRRHSSRRKTRWKSRYEEDESISADDYDDDDDGHRRQRSNRGKRRGKPIDEVQAGLRRSKRATRIDYSKYEMSNSEEENSVESETQVNGGELKKESDVSKSVDSNVENESYLNKPSEQARDEKQPNTAEAQSCEVFTEPVIKAWEQFREQSLDLKSRHFIDLNEAAPLSGFDDFSCDTMTKQIGPEDAVYKQVQNRENDDKC